MWKTWKFLSCVHVHSTFRRHELNGNWGLTQKTTGFFLLNQRVYAMSESEWIFNYGDRYRATYVADIPPQKIISKSVPPFKFRKRAILGPRARSALSLKTRNSNITPYCPQYHEATRS